MKPSGDASNYSYLYDSFLTKCPDFYNLQSYYCLPLKISSNGREVYVSYHIILYFEALTIVTTDYSHYHYKDNDVGLRKVSTLDRIKYLLIT